MKTIRNLAVTLLLGLIPAAFAHAVLVESTPAQGETLAADAESLQLVFSEGVEIDFSVVELYALTEAELEVTGEEDAYWADFLQNDELQDRLVETAVTADDVTVTVTPETELAAGEYVLVWRVLSIDTHTAGGFLRFNVEAAE